MPDHRGPSHAGTGYAPAGLTLAVVCCAGHVLLITLGLGGVGAVLGAVTGNPLLLATAGLVAGVLVLIARGGSGRRTTLHPADRREETS